MLKPEGKAEGSRPLEDTLESAESRGSNSELDDLVQGDTAAGNDYLKLRHLLLGNDYSDAINRYISKEEDVERIADALPNALKKSSQEDLGESLAPLVDRAIGSSIEQNPSRITNILFPIMGPAIRKAVSSALAEMVQSLNTLLEQSLSLGSLRWRIQAWRSGMPYAKYVLLQTTQFRVEQVLLVHKETGLLLNSVTAPEVETQDPELVSSMLTAISDFVSDSFSGGRETLERVRFGDLELHLYVGPKAILAIAVRGSASDELFSKAHIAIEKTHAEYAQALNHFEGDRANFDTTNVILSECLLSQKVNHKAKRKPWLALVVIVSVVLYLIFQSITAWKLEQQFNQLEAAINNQTGYLIISSKRENNQLHVRALRSPESNSALELERSLSDDIGLGLNIEAEIVHFGPLPEPVVKPKTHSELTQILVSKLQSTVFYFDAGEVSLPEEELLKVPDLISDILALEHLNSEGGFEKFQIMLIGFADSSGSSIINNKVSQRRAEEVKSMLTANQISSDIIVAWGVGHIDRAAISDNLKRRVTLQVLTMNQKQNQSLEEEPR